MIAINQTALPTPASLSVRVRPAAGTAQYNTLGQTVLDGMADKHTVTIAWTRMSETDLQTLSSLLSDGGFLSLAYPDPLSGSREMTCRVTDRSARVCRQAGSPAWADVTLTLEEQ